MTSPSLAPHPAPADRPTCDASALADILTEIAGGDPTRFADFYLATQPTVYSTVRRVLLCPQQSAEVTQEVYLQVWLQAARFDRARGAALGWLTTVARRRAVDRVRTAQASVVRDDAYAVDNPTSDVDSVWGEVARRCDAGVLLGAIDRLSAVQQEALMLTYFGGHTAVEVAALLNRPVGTIKTRIRDGLISLRRTLVPGYVEDSRSPVVGLSELGFLPVRTDPRELQSVA